MKFQQMFLRVVIGATTGALIATSAFANPSDTPPLTYGDVIKIIGQGGGNVKKTKALLTGRNISIKVRNGADTVTVNDKDRVFFACSNLKSFKAGATLSARVVDYSETSGDSDPLILLDSCNTAKAQPSASSVVGGGAGQVVYHTGGSPDYKEKFVRSQSAELSGKIVRDKNGGGWFYALVTPGQKPIRVDFETSENYKAFEKISDTDELVSVKGELGTFSDRSKAFDTTKPLTISKSL